MAGPLIAVWSPKGGVGKTLLASGLAMHLVRRTKGETMLIDLDASKADIAPLLKTSLRPSVLDYPDGTGRTVVHPSGLQVLPGPARLVDEGLITGELARTVLERATAGCDAVVADLTSNLRDSTLVTLERAEAVLLVTTPDLLSIYACRRFTQEAELIDLSLRRWRLVINRASMKQEIPDSEIVDLIGLPLAGRIPDLPGLSAAVNQGMTSATMRTNTELAVAVHHLADNLGFAGVPSAGAVRRTIQPQERPDGLIPTLRRWWRSL